MTSNTEPVNLDPTIDGAAIRKRYAAERDKRLRPDGIKQYQRLEGSSLISPRIRGRR